MGVAVVIYVSLSILACNLHRLLLPRVLSHGIPQTLSSMCMPTSRNPFSRIIGADTSDVFHPLEKSQYDCAILSGHFVSTSDHVERSTGDPVKPRCRVKCSSAPGRPSPVAPYRTHPTFHVWGVCSNGCDLDCITWTATIRRGHSINPATASLWPQAQHYTYTAPARERLNPPRWHP